MRRDAVLLGTLAALIAVCGPSRGHAASGAGPFAGSFECLFITGYDKDRNGEFSKTFPVVAGKPCLKAKGWGNGPQESQGVLRAAQLPAGQPLVVVQATHGNPGGTAIADLREYSGPEILDSLAEIAEARPVAFLDLSCSGGDLIAQQLLRDRAHPESPAVERLCLYAEALPNRIIYARDHGPELLDAWQPGENVEDLFRKTPYGLISSANWNSAGVTDLLSSPDLERATRAIEALAAGSRLAPTRDAVHVADLFADPRVGLATFRGLGWNPKTLESLRTLGSQRFLDENPATLPLAPGSGPHKLALILGTIAERPADLTDHNDVAFPEWSETGPESIAAHEPEREVTTAAFLVNYELTALADPKITDPTDLRRRSACRRFILKSN